jgi:hypothetical protein
VTTTPVSRHSSQSASENESRNAFVAKYIAITGPGVNADSDATFTMNPRLRSIIHGSTRLVR